MDEYIFKCAVCMYTTTNRQSYERHVITEKHENGKFQKYICECGKKYKHRQSLYNHRQKCNSFEDDTNFIVTSKMLYDLLKQNNDLHKKIMDIECNSSNNTSLTQQGNNIGLNIDGNNTIVINNTMHNSIFNLNFFLNEKCKDAMNISNFVNFCKIELSDLEETGNLGYVEGISRIVMRNLEELGIDLRPMHCSDMKRETIYIKENDVWVKEPKNQEKLKNIIKEITNKNFRQIYEWQKNNPEFCDPDSHISDKYQQILCNILPGVTREEQTENIDKVFKNIMKQITIDKKINYYL
jgi:hypothetical protein